MKKLIFSLSLLAIFSLSGETSIKEGFLKTAPGDFVVLQQGKNYFLICIKENTQNKLILEEISTVKKKSSWKKWIEEGALNNTSWLLFEVDLSDLRIVKCFSITKNLFLNPDSINSFLLKLLNLSFIKIPEEKRRKIGPQPEEEDRRAIWLPSCIKEGKKIKTNFNVFEATLPDDKTSLSNKKIVFYLTQELFLPCFIEIGSDHGSMVIREIDSGRNLFSKKNFPKQAIENINKE